MMPVGYLNLALYNQMIHSTVYLAILFPDVVKILTIAPFSLYTILCIPIMLSPVCTLLDKFQMPFE